MVEADLATADIAAGRAVAGVLAGERYVITHGDLVQPIGSRHEEIERALAQLERGSA